jgi:hypothetical protein
VGYNGSFKFNRDFNRVLRQRTAARPMARRAALQRRLHGVQRIDALLCTRGVSSDEKVANRNVRDFGWEIAHEAVSRLLPPISLYRIVPRTEGNTYDVKVWSCPSFKDHFSVAPCQTLANVTIRNFRTAV